MDYSAEYIAGFGIFFLKPQFELVDKRAVAGFVTLHYLAGSFVYYNKVVVFVDYFHVVMNIVAGDFYEPPASF